MGTSLGPKYILDSDMDALEGALQGQVDCCKITLYL